MKFLIPLLFFLFPKPITAQFYTVQCGKIDYKEKASIQEVPDTTVIETDSTRVERVDSTVNRYSRLTVEQLRYFVNAFEKSLNNQDSQKYKSPGKVHAFYNGDKRELNLYNLLKVMDEVGLSNQLFVMAQAVLETGHFQSRVCKEYHNLFGLFDSRNNDYFRFEKWEDSVVGYQKMIQYRYKGGNYLRFLKNIRYAEDPTYILKVAKTAKWLYKQNSNLFNRKSSVNT